jgi:pectate lyase
MFLLVAMRPRLPTVAVSLLLSMVSCATPGSSSRTADQAPAPAAAPPIPPAATVAGFPGAVGWAAHTPGGRGGRVIRVTSLAAAGPGSLAEAAASAGPRIIVFEVGGVIDLGKTRIELRQPFVTIAGQTAPAPGITLVKGGIAIKTHDVIIQHLRVRPGEAGAAKGSGWEMDAITTSSGAHDVIVDHCTTTWATDENLSASGGRFNGNTPDEWRKGTSHRITFSNCIIAEGLSESTHLKGEHSKGTLIHDNATDIAVVGNLYVSNVERNPLFKGGARGVVVNNYIHNSGNTAIKYNLLAKEWGDHPYQTGQMAIVGNVFTHGPDTPAGTPLFSLGGEGPCEIYLHDNVARDAKGGEAPLLGGASNLTIQVYKRPLWPEGLVPLAAGEVKEAIRRNVGARPWDRDPVDARIVEQALSGGGKVVHQEEEAGGYPALSEVRQPFQPGDWDLANMVRKPPR